MTKTPIRLVLRRHDESHTPTTMHWRYEVSFENTGEVLGVYKDPEFEAARELLSRGMAGQFTTRWSGSDHIAMTCNIESAAKLGTRESSKHGLSVRPYEIWTEEATQMASRSVRVAPSESI